MIRGNFEFIIAGMLDRENLTCEISYKGEEFAEITQETNELKLELYPPSNYKYWEIPFEEFQMALTVGKDFLLGLYIEPIE